MFDRNIMILEDGTQAETVLEDRTSAAGSPDYSSLELVEIVNPEGKVCYHYLEFKFVNYACELVETQVIVTRQDAECYYYARLHEVQSA